MSTIKKPHPLAIQTIYGWALPTTGELLVSRKGLPDPVEGFKIGRPWKNVTQSVVIENAPVVESAEVVEKQPVIKPKRVIRKKPVIETVDDNL